GGNWPGRNSHVVRIEYWTQGTRRIGEPVRAAVDGVGRKLKCEDVYAAKESRGLGRCLRIGVGGPNNLAIRPLIVRPVGVFGRGQIILAEGTAHVPPDNDLDAVIPALGIEGRFGVQGVPL